MTAEKWELEGISIEERSFGMELASYGRALRLPYWLQSTVKIGSL